MTKIIIREIIPLLKLLKSRGIDIRLFLNSQEINPDSIKQPDYRLSFEKLLSITNRAAILMGDEDTGLHQGEISFTSPAVPLYILFKSNDLGEALNRYITYEKIADESKHIIINTENNTVRIKIDSEDKNKKALRQMTDARLSTIYTFMKFTTKKEIWLNGIKLSHPEPADISEYKRIFKCPLRFNSEEDSITFNLKYMRSRIFLKEENLLNSSFIRLTEIAESLQLNEFSKAVTIIIAENLPGEPPSIEKTAKRMALTPESLDQKLKIEKTDFINLVNTVRIKTIDFFFNEPGISMVDIAYLLGFPLLSSFIKFFKAQREMDPFEYRLKKA